MPNLEVVEYTDPWCSWAWGTEPKLRRLRWRYGDRLAWRTVMGDLVADREDPSFDPVAAAPRLADYWHEAHRHTGMPWPAQLRWAPTASATAARAVKAAELQSDLIGRAMLRALRESCFVFCQPADRVDRVVEVADTVPGLDVDRFTRDLGGEEVEQTYLADRAETRQPNDYVRHLDEAHLGKGNAKPDGDGWRYVFPTVLFRGPEGEHTVPGWQPYERYEAAMESAQPGSTADPRPDPTPGEAFAEWPLLTEWELTFLCGEGSAPPASFTVHDMGGGVAWSRGDWVDWANRASLTSPIVR